MEPRRLVRVDVRPGLLGARRDSGAHLLHALAVEPARRRRGADGSLAPARRTADAGVLAGRATDVPADTRDEAGRRPRRAGPLGIHRAGERRRARVRVRAAVGLASRLPRPERDPRVPHERLRHEARHRLRGSARRDGARLRDRVGQVLPRAAREVRRLLRGLLRPGCRLLREDPGQREDVVHARRLPPPPAVRRHLREAGGSADGGLADPAREHADERDGQHLGPLPGQPRPVAPRRLGPRAPPRVRERGLRGVPVRRRRGRNHLRLRRPARRRHEPAADQRQHARVAHRRRRRRLLPRAGAGVLPRAGRSSSPASLRA